MLLAGNATAEEPATPIRIAYSAPASCPDVDVLVAHVLARTARARVAAPSEAARELAVQVDERKGGFGGRLLVPATSEGSATARELTDPSCDELIEALGFFIALSIDPHASASPSTPLPAASLAAPAPEPRRESSAEPSRTSPGPALPSRSPTAAASPSAPAEPRRAGVRSGSWIDRAGPWHFGVGAGAALVGGVAPNVLLGSRGFVDVSWQRSRDSVFAPLLSLGAVSTATGIETTALGGIALRLQALTGTVCPVELPIAAIAVLRPCSLLEAGRVRGEGLEIQNARRTEGDWVALGLSGRLSVRVWSALFLELELGGAAPVVWPRFRYNNTGATAFDTAALGGRTSLTLALHL